MKPHHPEPQQVRERFLKSSSPARPTVENTAGTVSGVAEWVWGFISETLVC